MARPRASRRIAKDDPPHGCSPRATAIVERAACPAVATSADNMIVACNNAFTSLVGGTGAIGRNLQNLLRCRHPNGNLLSSQHAGLHEMVLSGEAPAAFEIDVEPEGRSRTRVDVSVIVVFDSGSDDHRLVYLMRPRLRRRRTDAALDRLLISMETFSSTPVRRAPSTAASSLTTRQIQVLRLMAAGATASEMADDLGITPNTVRSHIRSIFETLAVTRQTEAVARALRDGLI